MLEIDSVWLEYEGRKILQSIYLQIEAGRITGLLGRNGTGKSCLMQIIYGPRNAQNKSVRLNKRYIEGAAYRQNGLMAYLPQHQFVPGALRVKEVYQLFDVDWSVAAPFFPLIDSKLNQRFRDLSGGERRLLETILIVLMPARFALLDEPFSNLSPLHVDQLKRLILQQKGPKGFLLSDHYYQDVLTVSDSVYLLLSGGRIVRLNDPESELIQYGYVR